MKSDPPISPTPPSRPNGPGREQWLTLRRAQMLALLALTLLVVYLCWRLVEPFVPALTWALVLAVVFNPLHERIRARVPGKSVVAALAVLLVTVAVAVPSVLVAQKVAEEALTHVEKLKGDPAKALMDQAIKRLSQRRVGASSG